MLDWSKVWELKGFGPVGETEREQRVRILTAAGAALFRAEPSSVLAALREDMPPNVEAAELWWNARFDRAVETGASPDENMLSRECRRTHVECLLQGLTAEAAIYAASLRWDRMCLALGPTAMMPDTAAETLRRMERLLQELSALRTHAVTQIEATVAADGSNAKLAAEQLYALREPEFEATLRWVEAIRASVEGTGVVPEGVLHRLAPSTGNGFDEAPAPMPAREEDAFGFGAPANDAPPLSPPGSKPVIAKDDDFGF